MCLIRLWRLTLQGITQSAEGQIILTSKHGDPITVSRGATGTTSDLLNLGFRESFNAGTVTGVELIPHTQQQRGM